MASLAPIRWWEVSPTGLVTGRSRSGTISVWIASGKNSWRPILSARIEPDGAGGSIVRGSIGSATWVNVFMLMWLTGALLGTGFLVAVVIAGCLSGQPTLRGGDGDYLPPVESLLLAVGAFVFFGGFGIGLPYIARRMSRDDADRIVEFLLVVLDGDDLNAGPSH